MELKYFATTNQNKLREASEILGVALEQITLDLLEPQAVKVEGVVEVKAKDAYVRRGEPVLVEDTSLEFEAWKGLPGALIKWFLDTVGLAGILKMLNGEINRAATAKAAVGFFNGKEARIFVGEVKGKISNEMRGSTGFGWDPLFIPDGFEKSFGEMTAEEKNAISHRRIAMDKLRDFLKQ